MAFPSLSRLLWLCFELSLYLCYSPCLFYAFLLFGVLLINCQCYLFGAIYLATSFSPNNSLCYIFVQTCWCPPWCFINMTIIFGVNAIFGKMLLLHLVIDHIIVTIVSVTSYLVLLQFRLSSNHHFLQPSNDQ